MGFHPHPFIREGTEALPYKSNNLISSTNTNLQQGVTPLRQEKMMQSVQTEPKRSAGGKPEAVQRYCEGEVWAEQKGNTI